MPEQVPSPLGFEAQLRAAEPFAYRAAYLALRNHEDAQDALQQARIRAWKNAGQLRDVQAFPAWLTRTARNCALNIIRYRRRRRWTERLDFEAVVDDCISPTAGPLETLLQGETIREAQQVICLLPRPLQVTLLLRMDGCSAADLTAVLGVEYGTIKSRTCRAKQAFAAEWKRRERLAQR